jgi:carbon-monoxide dehydrogenase medium subunit
MKPAPFRYIAAHSIEEALAAKSEHGEDARFLAGGQSLVPAMNFRLVQPAVLIDLNPLRELAGMERVDGMVRIGALTRYCALEREALVLRDLPLITEALPEIAHPQIRNRGTIGGNLSHADPASELPAIMVALKARFRIQAASGERRIAASDFFVGGLTTDLAAEEMLVEIELPARKPRTGSCFMEIARRRGDFAIVGVAAMVTLDASDQCSDVRLAYCGVGETPVDASDAAGLLVSHGVTEQAAAEVAEAIQQAIEPAGSVHATADYQRHVAGVLTERAVLTANQRARDGR